MPNTETLECQLSVLAAGSVPGDGRGYEYSEQQTAPEGGDTQSRHLGNDLPPRLDTQVRQTDLCMPRPWEAVNTLRVTTSHVTNIVVATTRTSGKIGNGIRAKEQL